MLEGVTGQHFVDSETLDLAILKRFQDNLIKQGHGERIVFFSQPEILVAIATKEKNYTNALEFRVRKLILLIKGSWEIMHNSLQSQKNASLICNIYTLLHVSGEATLTVTAGSQRHS